MNILFLGHLNNLKYVQIAFFLYTETYQGNSSLMFFVHAIEIQLQLVNPFQLFYNYVNGLSLSSFSSVTCESGCNDDEKDNNDCEDDGDSTRGFNNDDEENDGDTVTIDDVAIKFIGYYPLSSSRASNRVRSQPWIIFHQPAANPNGRHTSSLPILSNSNFFLAIFEYRISIGCE